MARRWHIQGFEDGNLVLDEWISGRLGERKIAQILARLQARHLTNREVLHFSLRSADKDALSELVSSTQKGIFTVIGGLDHYTARLEDPDA